MANLQKPYSAAPYYADYASQQQQPIDWQQPPPAANTVYNAPIYTCPTSTYPAASAYNTAYGSQPYPVAAPYASAPSFSTSAGPPPAAYPYQQQQASLKPQMLGKGGSNTAAETGAIDVESGIKVPNEITEDLDTAIRHQFVRKVYAVLGLQLLMTFGLAALFTLIEPMKLWMIGKWYIPIIGMVVSFIFMIWVSCVPSAGRQFPLNFILLTIITLGFTCIICYLVAITKSSAFFIACGITVAVVGGLTIFACQVKYDFTGWTPYLFVCMIVLLIVGIVCIFLRSRIADNVYAGLGALLFSILLVYDTQRVVGGKHRKYQYSLDDYIFASLTLYTDIIMLFMYIMSFFSNS